MNNTMQATVNTPKYNYGAGQVITVQLIQVPANYGSTRSSVIGGNKYTVQTYGNPTQVWYVYDSGQASELTLSDNSKLPNIYKPLSNGQANHYNQFWQNNQYYNQDQTLSQYTIVSPVTVGGYLQDVNGNTVTIQSLVPPVGTVINGVIENYGYAGTGIVYNVSTNGSASTANQKTQIIIPTANLQAVGTTPAAATVAATAPVAPVAVTTPTDASGNAGTISAPAGMSTTVKVLIGVAIVGAIIGGFFLVKHFVKGKHKK